MFKIITIVVKFVNHFVKISEYDINFIDSLTQIIENRAKNYQSGRKFKTTAVCVLKFVDKPLANKPIWFFLESGQNSLAAKYQDSTHPY